MKPSDIKRAQSSLREERRRLVEERGVLIREQAKIDAQRLTEARERNQWLREREDAVAALRMLCTRFGSNDWPDDTPLAEVLTEYLADPLEEMVARVNRRLQRSTEDVARLARPVAVPAPPSPGRHAVVIGRVADGFRVTCSCSWASDAFWTEGEALVASRVHARAGANAFGTRGGLGA